MRRAEPLHDLRDLLRAINSSRPSLAADGGAQQQQPVRALWYTQPPRSASVTVYKELATLLGLWHELRRGAHRGVHELWCAGELPLILVNTLHGPNAAASPFADLAPPPAQVFRTSGALKSAAKKAFRKLRLPERTSICRTREPSRSARTLVTSPH